MKKELMKLSALGGISGFESDAASHVRELLRRFCDETYIDRMGNVVGIKRGAHAGAKNVMLEAHIDGIGLMVKDIDERGFITFVSIGGVDTRILPSAEVTVCGRRELFGVIGAKPPHLQKAGESDKPAKLSDMAIDVGLPAAEVRNLVRPGDAVVFRTGAKMLSRDVISGKYLDDRAGIVSLLICLEAIKNIPLDFDITVLASVQEEVGCRGAATGAEALAPAAALVVDVCHGDTPDSGSESIFRLGGGCVVSKGPNIHPYLAQVAVDCAEWENIKYAVDVDGSDTGTDAWETQVAGDGVPSLLLSVPLRYMHTTVEAVSFSDVAATGKLLAATLQKLDLEALECYYQI